MHDSLAAAVLAGLGGMFGWGLADFFAKKTVDAIGDVASLVWAHLCGTAVIGAILLVQVGAGETVALGWTDWLSLAAFGALQAVVYLFVYRGFGKGQVAILAPLFASFAGLVAFVSVVALGEPSSVQLVVGLVVVFAGVVLLNADPARLRLRRFGLIRTPGFNEIAIATVLATAWTLGWDRFIAGHDWLSCAAVMYAFMTIALLVYGRTQRASFSVVRGGSLWAYLALIGGCEVGAYVAVSWGYEATTHTSVVALVSGAFALPTMALARIFLGERTGRMRGFASIMIVAGIMFLSTR